MGRHDDGRRRRGERFAKIPLEVLEHVAVTTLPLAAFKVLVVIAAGYNGANNGTLACTERWGARFGITGTDTVRRSLRDLVDRRLIEVTRPGAKMRKMPTLYALAWQPVHNRNGLPLHQPELASWRFRDWKPDPYSGGHGAVNTAAAHPYGGGSVTPTAGVNSAELTPIRPSGRPKLTPLVGDTLRISEGPDRERKARELMLSLPHLTDHEVARITKVDPMRVTQLRQHRAAGAKE